MAHKFIILY